MWFLLDIGSIRVELNQSSSYKGIHFNFFQQTFFLGKEYLSRYFRIRQNLEPFSYSIVKLMNRDVTIMNTGWTMVSSLLMNSQEIKGGKRIELHCWWTNDLLNEEKERLNKCTQPAMKLIGLRLVVWWHENRKVTLSNWEI